MSRHTTSRYTSQPSAPRYNWTHQTPSHRTQSSSASHTTPHYESGVTPSRLTSKSYCVRLNWFADHVHSSTFYIHGSKFDVLHVHTLHSTSTALHSTRSQLHILRVHTLHSISTALHSTRSQLHIRHPQLDILYSTRSHYTFDTHSSTLYTFTLDILHGPIVLWTGLTWSSQLSGLTASNRWQWFSGSSCLANRTTARVM